jgi:hypothetical protein
MVNKNTKKSKNSHGKAIEDLKQKLYEELNRLKGIMTGENIEVKKNTKIKPFLVPPNDTLIEDETISFESPQLTEKNISKDSHLKKKVRDGLIWKTAENYYELLNNPTYKKEYLKFLSSFQQNIINKFENLFFEGKNLNKELSEILNEGFDELKNRFVESSKLKEECIKFAASHYNSQKKYLNALDQIPRKYRKPIKKDIKDFIKKTSDVFELREKIISKMVSYAKEYGLKNALKERYKIFKQFFPEKQDFIEYNLKGWKISNKFTNILKKILVEHKETEVIYDLAFKMILESNETIIRDFSKVEAEKIYGT